MSETRRLEPEISLEMRLSVLGTRRLVSDVLFLGQRQTSKAVSLTSESLEPHGSQGKVMD